MHKKLGLVTLTSSLMLVAGCLTAPFTPPMGFVYSNVDAPLSIDHNRSAITSKRGEASSVCVLGLVSVGDVSTQAAAQNGGLKTIQYLDYKYFNILGIYQKTTVIVHGE